MLCSRFLNSREQADNWFHDIRNGFMPRCKTPNKRSLDKVLQYSAPTIFVSIAMTALTFYLLVVMPQKFHAYGGHQLFLRKPGSFAGQLI